MIAGLQHLNHTVRGKCHSREVSQLVYKATLFPSDARDVLQVSVPKESGVFLCQCVPSLRFRCLGKHCNWLLTLSTQHGPSLAAVEWAAVEHAFVYI